MDDNTKVSVFPNPATNKAIVEWSNDIVVNRIIVSDASGKVVLSKKTNTNLIQFQISNWNKGIYASLTNKMIILNDDIRILEFENFKSEVNLLAKSLEKDEQERKKGESDGGTN